MREKEKGFVSGNYPDEIPRVEGRRQQCRSSRKMALVFSIFGLCRGKGDGEEFILFTRNEGFALVVRLLI